jgi:hypothetical protein
VQTTLLRRLDAAEERALQDEIDGIATLLGRA